MVRKTFCKKRQICDKSLHYFRKRPNGEMRFVKIGGKKSCVKPAYIRGVKYCFKYGKQIKNSKPAAKEMVSSSGASNPELAAVKLESQIEKMSDKVGGIVPSTVQVGGTEHFI